MLFLHEDKAHTYCCHWALHHIQAVIVKNMVDTVEDFNFTQIKAPDTFIFVYQIVNYGAKTK